MVHPISSLGRARRFRKSRRKSQNVKQYNKRHWSHDHGSSSDEGIWTGAWIDNFRLVDTKIRPTLRISESLVVYIVCIWSHATRPFENNSNVILENNSDVRLGDNSDLRLHRCPQSCSLSEFWNISEKSHGFAKFSMRARKLYSEGG
jgi:hypothetical protein